jgi:hypothetical protein
MAIRDWSGDGMAAAYIKALPKIENIVKEHAPLIASKVYKDGRVEIIFS